MTIRFKYVLFLLALVVSSISVPAADLPTLPVDSRIIKGTLGCGATYYMVSNSSVKGYADIAVIRRDEAPSQEARRTLRSDFFSRMGIAPGPEGYLSDYDGSSVFRYRHVAFHNADVLDSTLLYTFSQMSRSRAEQAVIVCGDIDPVELKKKMDIFSMLVPRILVKESHTPDYVWEPSPAPSVNVTTVPGKKDVEISVTYSSARIPHNLMNTPQTLTTRILAQEFQAILGHRLKRNFHDVGIPYGEISFSSLGSADTPGDERYTVSVNTTPEYAESAMRTISSTIGELDSFGATVEEFSDAKRILTPAYLRKAAEMPSTEEDTDRCIAHFLYGAPLSPFAEEARLFARKNVPDSIQTRHFNQFSAALAEQLSNLSLQYVTASDSLDRDEALFYYNLAYLYGSIAPSGKDYSWHSADSLGLERDLPRVRIRTEKTEPITGGKLWTFSNGIRVAFKQIPGSGMFSYSLVLNGGLSTIKDIKPGEGGYFADILSLYDAGGLSAPAFRDLMESAGISMNTDVGVFSMSLSGDAPSSQLLFLLKTLRAIACDRHLNSSEFEKYLRSKPLRPASIEDKVFLQLNPGFAASASRDPEALSAETAQKADDYFAKRFARMNDGILLLAGDLDEGVVKKMLTRTLGGFDTDRGSLPRPAVDLRPIVGARAMEGTGEPGVYVMMDAPYAVTAQSFYTADIAAEALRYALLVHLAPYGYTVDVSPTLIVHPQERFRMFITCRPANKSGLPEDSIRDMDRAVTAVRAAIKNISGKPVQQAYLKAWKATVLQQVKDDMHSPEGAVTALKNRYAFGKDVSRYEESINSVTPEELRNFLHALASGGRIEYIVDE